MPTKGKVEIYGNQQKYMDYYGYLNVSGKTGVSTPGNIAYSLYANERIAASEFNAHSDVRIKQVQGRSESKADLRTLCQIVITDYTYKDTVTHDSKPIKKVIGQQIAEVFPQAVSTHTDVVPDIFQAASIADGWVSLEAHGLQVGERVRLLLEESEPKICTIEAVTPESFQVSLEYEGAQLNPHYPGPNQCWTIHP